LTSPFGVITQIWLVFFLGSLQLFIFPIWDLGVIVCYTGFFHDLSNSQKRNNFIFNLCIEDTITFNQRLINDTITKYYKNLFNETVPWHPKLDGLEFRCLDSVEVAWLERLFQEEQVLQALLSMNGDKASGHNDFTIVFLGLVGL